MPKTCYCALKLSRRIYKYALITPLLVYNFAKGSVCKKGTWSLDIFFHNYNYQGGTGKFIYKASILDNKQLLSNMIDQEATQVPDTTRIDFLADSYIFCSSLPAILCIIAIASYIAI